MESSEGHREAIKQPARRLILGYVLAAAALIWVFHDVRPEAVLANIAALNPFWLAAAITLDILSYVCQAYRWTLLLPTPRISTLRATQAIYAGLFINEIFPMRLGEIARAYLVTRWLETNFSPVVSSIVIERTFDAVWLMIGFALTAMFVPLPANLLRAGDILGVLVLLGIALLLYFGRHGRGPLGQISRSRAFYAAFGFSSLFLITQILSFWLVMRAYGLPLNVWAGAATLLIIHIGTAIPNAPANVGTYQFFCVLALTLLGIDKSTAAGFSVVVFLALTIPLWVGGFISLSRSGIRLADVARQPHGPGRGI